MGADRKILLHACCAPCACASVERLLQEGYKVTLFFSNSNIAPEEEYYKRLHDAKKWADILGIPFEEDEYNHQDWLEHIKGLEDEKETGKRCLKCFAYRLAKTAQKADKIGFSLFSTTLTLSPFKSSKAIFEIGKAFVKYLAMDFKKKDGFKRSLELSEQYQLYRQNYCGCEFSLRTKAKSEDALPAAT
ncbi:MAG: epoxyqueuosine reductase QueH [Verrucomicrobiota bacterium]